MKHIKINFDGMDGEFDKNRNFIVDILKKRYEVEIADDPG